MSKQPTVARPAAPKYQHVKELLRRQVLDGVYVPGSKLPPDSELHKRFKVHRLTIIRAMNDLMQEGLIVRRRGSGTYVANPNGAAPLIPGRTTKIGIVWRWSVYPQRMLNTFLGLATCGALESISVDPKNAAWALAPTNEPTSACWQDRHSRIHVECIGEAMATRLYHPPLEYVRARGFDGVLAMGVLEDSFLDGLIDLGIPIVLADVLKERLSGRIDQVFVDPRDGYRQAVQKFVQLGVKRIHFVAAQISLPAPRLGMTIQEIVAHHGNRVRVDPDSYLRLSAYRQAMDEYEAEVRDGFIHKLTSVLESDNSLAVRLAALPECERPEAVVCHGSTQADILINEFEQRGIRLLGAGATSVTVPAKAAAIRVDMKTIGATAMDLLLSRIQRPSRPCLRVGVPMSLESLPARLENRNRKEA